MNPTIDILMQRKSVRIYADRPVAESEREMILQAAMRAPTAGNMMLYSIIEIDDQALKDRLAVTCDNQPFIAKAPYLLLFAADYQRWYDYYVSAGVPELCQAKGTAMRCPEEGDLLLACCDALIAAQTAVTAAESLGIGSCYIGDILERFEDHQALLALPRYVLPITLICFGYPAPDQVTRQPTTRFDKQFIVHKNTYHRLNPSELEQMMQPRNTQLTGAGPRKDGIENIGQANYLRKFSAEFSVEMSRSVRAMLQSWTGQA